MHTQTLTGGWQVRREGAEEWLPATVPGGIHTDLMAAGVIPDPFAGDNERRVQWVAREDWRYRRTFTVEPGLLDHDKVFLAADGLDTLAAVTLNGQEIGRTDNMFRQYRWDVKGLLRSDGPNEIEVAFASPVKYVKEKQTVRALPGVSQAIPGGPYLRKAPCQFGWDWGPQLPPTGIWKDIRLEGHSTALIEEVHLRQHHAEGQVTVEARV
ncbi:MAG TPA: glycoside hydrolase family 2 protein, partial [Chloroflexia bacterium]|nr:glycoside hydrolase family 2 protein [Chloroflexia bacterium]